MRSWAWPALFLSLLLLVPFPSARAQRGGAAPRPAASARGNADFITAAQLRDYLTFNAADELEGRDTPSRGLDTAARFIATLLSRWGIRGGGDDGTYFQRIALRRDQLEPAGSRVELNGQAFVYGQDFLATGRAGTGSGSLVYVGHGYVVKAKGIDAYSGVSVRDKVIVALGYGRGGLPNGLTRADLRGKQGEAWDDAAGYAARNGARGVILVPSPRTLANWDFLRRGRTGGRVVVEAFEPVEAGSDSSAPGAPPSITASRALVEALFAGERVAGAELLARAAGAEPGAAFDLKPGKQVKITVAGQVERLSTQNVVGILEGSDPQLKHEYVALGAHYDHVGMSPNVEGDRIFNGADDDGSGTVAILAMAEALARAPRPKRSILFVWHAGEEKGLWGSRYIMEHSPVPVDRIVAQLKKDMIGRSRRLEDMTPANQNLSGPNEIYVIGSKVMSTELGAVSEAVNRGYLNVTFNYRYDAPNDPNRFFFRSDHINYARKGIPIIVYFDGVHEDYHRVTDHAEKIDYAKLEKVTRTIHATAWEIANLPRRPKVDRPLPAEFGGQ